MSPPVRLERKYIPANVRVIKTASNRADVSVTPIPRYKALGEAPVVVFVVEDQDKSGRFLKAAGRIITGRIGTRGVPESAWRAYGRRRLSVVAERDVHEGSVRAQRLAGAPSGVAEGAAERAWRHDTIRAGCEPPSARLPAPLARTFTTRRALILALRFHAESG
jgi:hypothetical protein